jgi:hypothetical protein
MKTIITVLATAMLAVGATTAMAAPQGSNEAAGYVLSHEAAADDFDGPHIYRGTVPARGSRDVGAYASARELPLVHDDAFDFPDFPDFWDFFYLDGR